MRILIVAKTRRGTGACIGGITAEGKSVRLEALDAATNQQAGLEYQVGEVWEVQATPPPDIEPPHLENLLVRRKQRVATADPQPIIEHYMPPRCGGLEQLFAGLTQAHPVGALYIAQRSGVPPFSTMFWRPDQPLQLDTLGKRLRYRYPTPDGGRTLTFVGFQEPLEMIPAGTLVRVSLAHWWRPSDEPEHELRCYLQLSGWFLDTHNAAAHEALAALAGDAAADHG
jgi:hypothetical protein